MKVLKKKDTPQATRLFTDREEPRESFWKNYNMVKGELHNGDIRVLMYYGIGGIGKTTLLKKLISEMHENIKNPKVVYYDFDVNQDSRSVLESLRNQLTDTLSFKFPLFDLGLYSYAKKIGENLEGYEIKSFVSRSPVLSCLVEVAGVIPTVNTIVPLLKAADMGYAYLRNVVNNNKRDIVNMEYQSPKDLYENLPYLFSQDLTNNLSNTDEPLVIIFDSYEELVNEMASVGEPLNNDLWIRGTKGLILNTPDVLWVIAGREKLKWEKFDAEWIDALDTHILGSLSKNDTINFLKEAGINNLELCDQLYTLTQGTPVYLDVCLERYFALLDAGNEPAIEDFGKNVFTLIDRFMRYMDDHKKDIVYVLSCLSLWNDEMVMEVASKAVPGFSVTTYEKVKGFSFINKIDSTTYGINQTVGATIVQSCPDVIKDKTQTAAIDYCSQKLNTCRIFSSEYIYYLQWLAKFALLKYTDEEHEELKSFYITKLRDPLLKLSDAGQSTAVNTIFYPLFEKAQSTGMTLLHAEVLKDYSAFLQNTGKYEDACYFFEKAIYYLETLRGKDHEDTLTSKLRFTESLLNMRSYQKAYNIANSVYTTSKEVLGDKHPITLNALNYLSCAQESLGQYKEALSSATLLFELREELLGLDRPDTYTAMGNLAALLNTMGRTKECLKLEEELLEREKTSLGENHLDTIWAMSNLAHTLADLERYDEALELFQKVADKRNLILGENHPDTLESLQCIASTLKSMERYEEAFEIQKDVCERLKNTLGENHPESLSSCVELAVFYADLDAYEDARKVLEDVLCRQKELLGDTNPDTITTMCNLAQVMELMEEYEEALSLNNNILSLQKEVLGENNLETFNTIERIISNFKYLERYDEALILCEKLLEKRAAILGEDNPDTINTFSDLATIMYALERYDEAEVLYKKVLDKRVVVLGEDNPNTIETMSDLADVLSGKEQYDKAELLYKKVLEKRAAVLGEEDPDTIETMNDLATVLDFQEKYDESLLLYRKVMAKNIEIFGEDDPDTIESIYNVASTLVPLEKYNEAKKFAEKAYTLGKAHLNYDEYGELLEDIEELLDEL